MEVKIVSQLCAEVSDKGRSDYIESGQSFDCKLLVGAEPHQVIVAGHKLILAMASPVFEAMFYGPTPVERDVIPMPDIDPEIFKTFLRYIYTDRLNISCVDEASQLLYIAKRFMLQQLENKCDRYLWNHVNAENIWKIYKPELLQSSSLLQKCEMIICTNTRTVLNDSSFEDVDLNTVVAVFSFCTLNIDSEVELIEAAARYAKAQGLRNKDRTSSLPSDDAPLREESSSDCSDSGDEGINDENIPETAKKTQDVQLVSFWQLEVNDYERPISENAEMNPDIKNKSIIRRVTEKIRFLSLTPQQFAECLARRTIMTPSEEEAVKMNIESKNCDVGMPKGFSTCRVFRHRMIIIGSPNEDEARAEATFRYTIQDFKTVKDLVSPACYVRHLPWQLRVTQEDYYNIDGQQLKYSKYTIRCNGLRNSIWSCNATTTLTLVSPRQGESNCVFTLTHLYNSEKDTGHFSTANITSTQEAKYIKEGSITLQVHIKADTPQEMHPKSSVWW